MGLPFSASAEPDRFIGDTAIYSSSTEYLRPNVLFIIDNSAGMAQAGSREPYDPDHDYSYTGGYPRYQVLERKSSTGGNTANYVQYIDDVNADVSCGTAQSALTQNGFYAGELKKNDGSCSAAQPGNYYLGNLLNYIDSTTPTWAANHSYSVGDKVQPTTLVTDSKGTPLTFEVVTSGTSGASEPTWPTQPFDSNGVPVPVTDGGVVWEFSGTILQMVQTTVNQVVAGARDSVNFGIMVFGDSNKGGKVLEPVQEIDTTAVDGPTHYTALTSAINNISLLNANSEPVNEALWDGGVYYSGGSDYIDTSNTSYSSPITKTCQKNYIIVLTTGNADQTNQTSHHFGDIDGDDHASLVDDAAKYLYETDMSSSLGDTQRVQTDVIQLLTPKVDRLERATDGSHGRGEYFQVQNANELTSALLATMNNIVLEANTAFVAPVVPSSPENRTESGQRVYLGFFKPISQKPWHGNLKKYGIGSNNSIVDVNGIATTNSDGTFNVGAQSYWSSAPDGGEVESGGTGEKLLGQSSRNIYTYLGTSNNLTDSSNAITTGNTDHLTTTVLGLDSESDPSGERTKLINFIHGFDAYDYDGDGDTGERRDWILGDILHSKPLVLNYKSYDSPANMKTTPTITKPIFSLGPTTACCTPSRISTGRRPGPSSLPVCCPILSTCATPPTATSPTPHPWCMSMMLTMTEISSQATGIMPFSCSGPVGAGGKIISPPLDIHRHYADTRGAYYFLNVTDPTNPKYMGKIDSNTVDGSGNKLYPELGETWSVPRLAKVKVGSSSRGKWLPLSGPATTTTRTSGSATPKPSHTGRRFDRYLGNANQGEDFSTPEKAPMGTSRTTPGAGGSMLLKSPL